MVDTKSIYEEIYKPNGVNYAGVTDDFINNLPKTSQDKTLAHWMKRLEILPEQSVAEIGCGFARHNKCHPNWTGYEFSSEAIKIATTHCGVTPIEADARDLPINDGTVDFLFSFHVFEHIPKVEQVYQEVERVLATEGYGLIAQAWNCRPWTVKKLEQRPYSELTIAEKIGKFLIPIRNSLAFRFLLSIPKRLLRELKAWKGGPVDVDYLTLTPRFDLWDRFEHISDDDAFVSMDAHSAIIYFKSRGYMILSHPSFLRRIFCRGEAVVVKKV
jgi:SAM-dependent methyltransferase